MTDEAIPGVNYTWINRMSFLADKFEAPCNLVPAVDEVEGDGPFVMRVGTPDRFFDDTAYNDIPWLRGCFRTGRSIESCGGIPPDRADTARLREVVKQPLSTLPLYWTADAALWGALPAVTLWVILRWRSRRLLSRGFEVVPRSGGESSG